MIDVKIEPHRTGMLAGKYDIRAYSAGNHELLVFSAQGYENASDAVDTAKKLFASNAHLKLRKIRDLLGYREGENSILDEFIAQLWEIVQDDATDTAEHVDLTVVDWEGRGRTEPIR